MKFLADENFPGPSIIYLRNKNVDLLTVAEIACGISDEQVMQVGLQENRTILTHDSDYGELIFKFGLKPQSGVVYFRIYDFEPDDPGKILLDLINQGTDFTSRLTVVSENSVRQRLY